MIIRHGIENNLLYAVYDGIEKLIFLARIQLHLKTIIELLKM